MAATRPWRERIICPTGVRAMKRCFRIKECFTALISTCSLTPALGFFPSPLSSQTYVPPTEVHWHPSPPTVTQAPVNSNPAPVPSNPAPVYSKPAPVYSNPAPVHSNLESPTYKITPPYQMTPRPQSTQPSSVARPYGVPPLQEQGLAPKAMHPLAGEIGSQQPSGQTTQGKLKPELERVGGFNDQSGSLPVQQFPGPSQFLQPPTQQSPQYVAAQQTQPSAPPQQGPPYVPPLQSQGYAQPPEGQPYVPPQQAYASPQPGGSYNETQQGQQYAATSYSSERSVEPDPSSRYATPQSLPQSEPPQQVGLYKSDQYSLPRFTPNNALYSCRTATMQCRVFYAGGCGCIDHNSHLEAGVVE
jgi:hypothetical protein